MYRMRIVGRQAEPLFIYLNYEAVRQWRRVCVWGGLSEKNNNQKIFDLRWMEKNNK